MAVRVRGTRIDSRSGRFLVRDKICGVIPSQPARGHHPMQERTTLLTSSIVCSAISQREEAKPSQASQAKESRRGCNSMREERWKTVACAAPARVPDERTETSEGEEEGERMKGGDSWVEGSVCSPKPQGAGAGGACVQTHPTGRTRHRSTDKFQDNSYERQAVQRTQAINI